MLDSQDASVYFQAVSNAAYLTLNPKKSLSGYIYGVLCSAMGKYSKCPKTAGESHVNFTCVEAKSGRTRVINYKRFKFVLWITKVTQLHKDNILKKNLHKSPDICLGDACQVLSFCLMERHW